MTTHDTHDTNPGTCIYNNHLLDLGYKVKCVYKDQLCDLNMEFNTL